MKFIQCFHGRRSEAEIAELSEEVVLVSKYFMLHKHHTFAQSVGGLYLLYLMVHLQPFKGFAPVRFIPEDVEPILDFKKKAAQGKHYDVLYILGSLLIEGPAEFHIAERPYGLERQVNKYFGAQTSVASSNVSSVLSQDLEKEFDLLRQLSNTAKNYKSKKDFVMKMIKSDNELNYVQDDFAEEVEESLKNLVKINDVKESSEKDGNIWALKRQAMRSDVNSMRHLNSVKSKNPLKKRRINNLSNSKRNSPVASKSSKRVTQDDTSKDPPALNTEGNVIYEFIVVNNDSNEVSQTAESKLNETDAPIVLDLPILFDDAVQPSKSGETIRNNTEYVEKNSVITDSIKKEPKVKNKSGKVSSNTPKAVKSIAKAKTKVQSKKQNKKVKK